MNRQFTGILLFFFVSIVSAYAQKPLPDTSTVKFRRFTYHSCVISMENGDFITSYSYLSEYSPEKKIYHKNKTDKNPKPIAVTAVKAIDYYDSHFVKIYKEGSTKKFYMARAITEGKVNLYGFLERNSVPIAVPMLGQMLHSAIRYDNSILFIKNEKGFSRVDKKDYRETFKQLCKDNTNIVSRLEKAPYKDIPEIIKAYNVE